MYNDNRNGHINCVEANGHGITPVRQRHLAYQYTRDADGEDTACE